jgi:hypothetical protein
MSDVGKEDRSYKQIEISDLKKLAIIASNDRKRFFHDNPIWEKHYADRVLCVALCQGAAKYYLDGETGINDFDVYTFYKTNPTKQWCYRRKLFFDYNDPKFGQSKDKPKYIGRRVDCLGRAIEVKDGENIISALRRYLTSGKTKTARCLAEKAVVLLEPSCGKIVWPLNC